MQLTAILRGKGAAYAQCERLAVRRQVELTRTGSVSATTTQALEDAREVYHLWVAELHRWQRRRQVEFERDLEQAAMASARPTKRPKRKRARKRTRPAPQTTPLPGLGEMA